MDIHKCVFSSLLLNPFKMIMNITQTTVKMRYLCRSFAIAFSSAFLRKGTPDTWGQTGGLRSQLALSLAIREVSFSIQQGSWRRSTIFQQCCSIPVQLETCLWGRRPDLGAQDRRPLGRQRRQRHPEGLGAAMSSQEGTSPQGREHNFSPQTANHWRLTARGLFMRLSFLSFSPFLSSSMHFLLPAPFPFSWALVPFLWHTSWALPLSFYSCSSLVFSLTANFPFPFLLFSLHPLWRSLCLSRDLWLLPAGATCPKDMLRVSWCFSVATEN